MGAGLQQGGTAPLAQAGGGLAGTTTVVPLCGGGGSLLLKLRQPASSSGRRMAMADQRMKFMEPQMAGVCGLSLTGI